MQNFLSGGQNLHFVEDHDLAPIVYAEQFGDPDPAKALPAEELLRQARMIIATELGLDPLLRQSVRDQFKQHAQVSCLPTDRGKLKLDQHHAYYVREPFRYPDYRLTILLSELQVPLQQACDRDAGLDPNSPYIRR